MVPLGQRHGIRLEQPRPYQTGGTGCRGEAGGDPQPLHYRAADVVRRGSLSPGSSPVTARAVDHVCLLALQAAYGVPSRETPTPSRLSREPPLSRPSSGPRCSLLSARAEVWSDGEEGPA